MRKNLLALSLATVCVCNAFIAVASAQPYQVNGAGATLFVDFFRSPAASNDFIDVDGDGTSGPLDTNGDGTPDDADQLAPGLSTGLPPWWHLQYRSVGSVEGFSEFVTYQLCADLPEGVPSERGTINAEDFAVTGVVVWVGPPASCTDDTDMDGINNLSGTPICPETIDFGNVDVSTLWATQGPGSGTNAKWNRKPGDSGYGLNPSVSWGLAKCNQIGESNLLAPLCNDCDGDGTVDSCLNTNLSSPDSQTIYDTVIAFSPVAFLSNAGVAIDRNGDGTFEGDITFTNLQHLFVTGRSECGENLAVCTRDVGSGTRNAVMNPINVDPSQGVGDHLGKRINSATLTNLGPCHQHNNCGGSSIIENSVQNVRLAVGYTGLVGPSRAVSDARSGRYEILNTIKNVDGDGDGTIDSSVPVRPKLNSVIFNADPDTGYQIGGLQTLATVGDPDATRDPADPLFPDQNGDGTADTPPMTNTHAADFINNIVSSIEDFVDSSGAAPPDRMPADLLARTFFLVAAIEALPKADDPTDYDPNAVTVGVRTFVLANNELATADTPNYGSINLAGRVPVRNPNPDFDMDGTIDGYSDGSLNGAYKYKDRNGILQNLSGGGTLSVGATRNRTQGDFNFDRQRDCDDIADLVEALALRFDSNGANNFDFEFPPGYAGGVNDVVVVDLIGDFNADGNFDLDDAKYFADGLAIDPITGKLNRCAGFTKLDEAWATRDLNGDGTADGDNNMFDTVLKTGKQYAPGDSTCDVAGNPVCRGANPSGCDGIVDEKDIDYVWQQIEAGDLDGDGTAEWAVLDEAALFDLSADINGDLKVNALDIEKMVLGCLCTEFGDVDLDGDVDAADITEVNSNIGTAGGWADGDINCDGQVTAADLALATSNLGFTSPCCGTPADLCGDANCDGTVDSFDIAAFTLALTNPTLYATTYPGCPVLCVADTDGNGFVDSFDIAGFVQALTGAGCPRP